MFPSVKHLVQTIVVEYDLVVLKNGTIRTERKIRVAIEEYVFGRISKLFYASSMLSLVLLNADNVDCADRFNSCYHTSEVYKNDRVTYCNL